MLAWHLGCRYLRRRRAAWLALAAITLTVAVPVVVLGVMQGFVDTTRRQVRANESDLTLEPPYASGGMRLDDAARERIAGIAGVAGVAPFIETFAIMTPKEAAGDMRRNVPCRVDAVEWGGDEALGRVTPGILHPAPVMDLQAPPLPPERRGSGFLTPAWRHHLVLTGMELMAPLTGMPAALPPRLPPTPGVVVGRELSYSNGIRLGSTVTLTVPNGSGGAVGRVTAEVCDTLGTGVYEVDRYTCLMPLPMGQRLADLHAKGERPARAGGWRVRAQDEADLHALRRTVVEQTGMHALTWMERRGNMVKSLEVQRNILGLVMVLIQVIAVFIVYAVFSTLVAEKRHDIGVLLGLGARRRDIANAFITAGMVACVGGGLIGWALGWGVLAALNPFARATGIVLFPQDVLYTPEAPTSWNPLIPLFFIGVMTLVGLLAVWLPAWRASRIDPIETLRENG